MIVLPIRTVPYRSFACMFTLLLWSLSPVLCRVPFAVDCRRTRQAFFQQFYPPNVGHNVTIIGPNVPSSPGIEASLDVEYSTCQ